MAGETLDRILFDGESSAERQLESRLSAWVAATTKQPTRARRGLALRVATAAAVGESRQALIEQDYAPGTLLPEHAHQLLDDIRRAVVERHGPAPAGKLFVRLYPEGKSANQADYLLYIDRVMDPRDDSDPILAQLPNQLMTMTMQAQSHAAAMASEMRIMAGEMRAVTQSQSILIAEQAKAMAALATTRTAASAASDQGSIWQLAAFGGVLLSLPWLAKNGQTIGSSLGDLVSNFKRGVAESAIEQHRRVGGDGASPQIDFSALPSEPAIIRVLEEGAPTPPPMEPASILARAKEDPEWRAKLIGAVREDSDFASLLMSEFL